VGSSTFIADGFSPIVPPGVPCAGHSCRGPRFSPSLIEMASRSGAFSQKPGRAFPAFCPANKIAVVFLLFFFFFCPFFPFSGGFLQVSASGGIFPSPARFHMLPLIRSF